MRIINFIILLLITNMAFAMTTIHTTIKQGTYIPVSWWEKELRLSNEFPQKHNESQGIPFKNPYFRENDDSQYVNVRNSNLIVLTFTLDLISYDKATNFYKFKLSVSEVVLEKGIKYKAIPAEVYFDNANSKTLLLTGKFKPIPKGSIRAPLDHKEKDDIVLSVDVIQHIIIATQHDIPLTINLHD